MTPAPARRMGEGYEPHVDVVDGGLVYSLPVDSSFVSLSFAFAIEERDLAVLLADPYRRAVLEVVAHTVPQRAMIRGNPAVSAADFRRLVDQTLHTDDAALARHVAQIDRDHNISVAYFVRQALARRGEPAPGSPGQAT